ncbi:TlpA family protein disulfide reductase [Guyparkeria hydrothermalis]|uniref:TlpA family protein disulfide reductase n=1 Tax=Guyparkeria hydrothermalis TaxID=923 RepID=UPI002021F6D2|nr:TlpA disulfide reductase family protein [Guyparkeria hydrothermalis]MCL7744604.1 TlpA family protein disulfide reductase [Guyparkeria hydrothermalis]
MYPENDPNPSRKATRRRAWQGLLAALLLPLVGPTAQAADIAVPVGEGGDRLEVQVIAPADGAATDGPLVLWMVNQYGDMPGPTSIAHALVRQGATVWMVDLLDSLFLTRSDTVVRERDGTAVAALIGEAVKRFGGERDIAIVGSDRMAVPILRGMRAWQQGVSDTSALAGAVLLFPNLYRGTPVAGEEPEFFGIVDATNLPVMVFQPERGVYMNRVDRLWQRLLDGGSDAFVRVIPETKDYYFIEMEAARTESLDTVAEVLKSPDDAAAVRALPRQIRESIPLLAGARHPAQAAELDGGRAEPLEKQVGLTRVEPEPAPDFELTDLQGRTQRLDPDFDGVQIVNFWATWCPACVEEIPSMERLAQRYPDRLRIYAIDFKESPEHVRDFMQDFDISFPVSTDVDGEVAERYGAFAFPTSFMVAPDGRIHYSVNAGIIWDTPEVDAIMRELLAIEPD